MNHNDKNKLEKFGMTQNELDEYFYEYEFNSIREEKQ